MWHYLHGQPVPMKQHDATDSYRTPFNWFATRTGWLLEQTNSTSISTRSRDFQYAGLDSERLWCKKTPLCMVVTRALHSRVHQPGSGKGWLANTGQSKCKINFWRLNLQQHKSMSWPHCFQPQKSEQNMNHKWKKKHTAKVCKSNKIYIMG